MNVTHCFSFRSFAKIKLLEAPYRLTRKIKQHTKSKAIRSWIANYISKWQQKGLKGEYGNSSSRSSYIGKNYE
jgi:hypothetical protein